MAVYQTLEQNPCCSLSFYDPQILAVEILTLKEMVTDFFCYLDRT